MEVWITYLILQARVPGASGGKPQMEDEDYDLDVITKMMKNYFQNLETQIMTGKKTLRNMKSMKTSRKETGSALSVL